MTENVVGNGLVFVIRISPPSQTKCGKRSKVLDVWRTGQSNPRVSFRVGRTAVVRRHRTKRPVRTSSPVPLRALTYLITKELKRSDSLYGVMLENHELKSENEMLKRKLKHRNKQVKLLSLDMLHHREVMKQHKEKIQMQMSQTENIQIQLQGLSLAVQDWETEQQRASKIKKEWN